MYADVVKRVQILMDEELDVALERLSAKRRTSKSALIREFVRERVNPLPPLEEDPIWKIVGDCEFEPVAPEDIDRVVYIDEVEREMHNFDREMRARRRARGQAARSRRR